MIMTNVEYMNRHGSSCYENREHSSSTLKHAKSAAVLSVAVLLSCLLAISIGCSKRSGADKTAGRTTDNNAPVTTAEPGGDALPTEEVRIECGGDPERAELAQGIAQKAKKDPSLIPKLIARLSDHATLTVERKSRSADGVVTTHVVSMPCSAWAEKALVEVGAPAVPHLEREMRQGKNQLEAIKLLASVGDPGVQVLVSALRDKTMQRHFEVIIESLASTKNPAAVEPIIAALKTDNDHVRKAAASALCLVGDRRAVGPLIEVLRQLNDEGGSVEAAEALGLIGDRSAVEPLIDAAEQGNVNTRTPPAFAARAPFTSTRCIEALEKLTGKDFGPFNEKAWREWWNKNKETFLSAPPSP